MVSLLSNYLIPRKGYVSFTLSCDQTILTIEWIFTEQVQVQFQGRKIEDALAYLNEVESEFYNQPHVYKYFLGIMKAFHKQSIDMPGLVARISCLFRGHPDLIAGFNNFLPRGHKVRLQSSDSMAVNVLGADMKTIHAMSVPRNDNGEPFADFVFELELNPNS